MAVERGGLAHDKHPANLSDIAGDLGEDLIGCHAQGIVDIHDQSFTLGQFLETGQMEACVHPFGMNISYIHHLHFDVEGVLFTGNPVETDAAFVGDTFGLRPRMSALKFLPGIVQKILATAWHILFEDVAVFLLQRLGATRMDVCVHIIFTQQGIACEQISHAVDVAGNKIDRSRLEIDI